ncbi:methionine--tRNA ligase [Candidatus Shapirobacteria bacterium]|nr:methionine--tRNA ligase [Candidatus Shapirobacteria bacterium]
MNKKNKFYITTPIYYVNDIPHIGHAYTTIAADVLARYQKNVLGEENVFFLTGTDEHGAKIAEAAKKARRTPQAFCDKVSLRFKNAWKNLNISNDYFFRTTDERHIKRVQEIFQKIYENGKIYLSTYEELYCIGCEKYLKEKELINDCCPLHPNQKLIKQKERNYFFKLKDYEKKLINLIDDNKLKILPPARKHEILSKIALGLENISISREGVKWGIPLPWDSKQTLWVWADALLNYYTATQFLEKKGGFWPPDLHLVGKDILWFHAVIWPALLLAAGIKEDNLPKKIFAHGFFTINGQKISKSLGNVISPEDLIKKFGVDGTRYLLLSEFPFGTDGDISIKKFKTRYNADLANGLGNLVARVAKLFEKNNLNIKEIKKNFKKENDLESNLRVSLYLEELKFDEIFKFVWGFISGLDKYINRERPWEKDASEAKKILGKIILGSGSLVSLLKIAEILESFLPETSKKIKAIFEKEKIQLPSKPLFPRLD